MSVIRDLLVGAVFLAPIGVGVGLVAAFGRDRTADEHDLSDYHQPVAEPVLAQATPPAEVAALVAANPSLGRSVAWPLLDRKPMPVRGLRPAAALTAPVGLAAWETAVGTDGPVPPLARALMIEWAVPTLSDAVVRATADDWLREIAAEQQARAGIRPVVSPATDRDLTGAFAVVAVA